MTLEKGVDRLSKIFPEVNNTYYRSNVESELIDLIQQVGFHYNVLITNLGGHSAISAAMHDVMLTVPSPKVEAHLSNNFARKEYRHHSPITSAYLGIVCGLGLQGYEQVPCSLL